jgi:CRP-like cAMP-binding protein
MGKKIVCLRGQVIAREGKSADNLFIVYEGEFEQVKTVTSEVKEKK